MTTRRAKHVPTDIEIAELLTRADPQLRLVLILMADAGCRLREALAFDVSSLSGNLLRIWSTKTSKWRSVPLTRRLRSAIDELQSRPIAGTYPRWVQRRFDELAAAAGMPKSSPHRLRHAYATRLALEGVPAHVIMQLMGHANLATTLVYVHTDDEDFSLAAAALDRRAAAAQRAIPDTQRTQE